MNKLTKSLVFTAGLLGSLLAQPVLAEQPVTLNLGAARWFFDNERDVDDATTPWASIEYAFSDRWAVEVLYNKDDTTYSDGTDTDIENWQLGLLMYGGSYAGKANRVRPYATFGAGEINLEADDFDTVETTVNLGAGLRWMWTQRFGARLEAKMLHSLDEHHTDVLLSAGLNYYFGDVGSDSSAAAAVGAGAAVGSAAQYGDQDADGDGVPDDRDQCPGTPQGTRVDSVGCPLKVERIASIKLKVNFDFDKAVVKEQYFSDIAELAAFLQRFEDLQVDVEGHTDSTGPDAYNQGLSERRAQAVVDLLVNRHGIDASRLQAVGYGESQPVASNDSREGRAENRRVMATLEVEYEE